MPLSAEMVEPSSRLLWSYPKIQSCSLLSYQLTKRGGRLCLFLLWEGNLLKPPQKAKTGHRLHVLVVNMKGIYRDGYYDGSIELRDVFNRRCVKCGRRDFVQAKTMRIRTGIVFWNLVFSLMFTCVKGTSHCRNSLHFRMRWCASVCVCARMCACVQEIKTFNVTDVHIIAYLGSLDGLLRDAFRRFCAQCRLWQIRSIDILAVAYASSNSLRELLCLVG